jgi:hypothetical protein
MIEIYNLTTKETTMLSFTGEYSRNIPDALREAGIMPHMVKKLGVFNEVHLYTQG